VICDSWLVTRERQDGSHPHPRCFAKRVRKLLKTNEASDKKRAKREKSPQEYENTGFVGGGKERS